MIIDGNAIAADLKLKIGERIRTSGKTLTLGIVIVGDDPVVENFVRIKKKVAEALGVVLREYRYPKEINEEELLGHLSVIRTRSELNGLIIQLPLPGHVHVQTILNSVPPHLDVDMLSHNAVAQFRKGEARILPPVVGAIQEIFERHHVSVGGKDVLVLGHGRLVGIPAAIFLRHNDAHVTVVDKEIARLAELTKEADIIISGVGKPGMLQPEMLKEGVVLIDAGTSETGGRIVGDAESKCADIAGLFTPVPGGVGPITVAMIFKNLYMLSLPLNSLYN